MDADIYSKACSVQTVPSMQVETPQARAYASSIVVGKNDSTLFIVGGFVANNGNHRLLQQT